MDKDIRQKIFDDKNIIILLITDKVHKGLHDYGK